MIIELVIRCEIIAGVPVFELWQNRCSMVFQHVPTTFLLPFDGVSDMICLLFCQTNKLTQEVFQVDWHRCFRFMKMMSFSWDAMAVSKPSQKWVCIRQDSLGQAQLWVINGCDMGVPQNQFRKSWSDLLKGLQNCSEYNWGLKTPCFSNFGLVWRIWKKSGKPQGNISIFDLTW